MKFTLKEMNGLLNGKCLPSDLIVGETLAEYLVRKFDELEQQLAESHRALRAETTAHENTQMQMEKMASENAGLIEQAEEVYAAGYNHGHLNTVDGIAYADCVKDDFYGLAAELMREAETPATDAFLAEVRASAITDALKSLDGVFDTDCVMESNGISYEDAEQRTAGAYAVSKALDEFAAQLRKGGQS